MNDLLNDYVWDVGEKRQLLDVLVNQNHRNHG